jgi:hypothetical protein
VLQPLGISSISPEGRSSHLLRWMAPVVITLGMSARGTLRWETTGRGILAASGSFGPQLGDLVAELCSCLWTRVHGAHRLAMNKPYGGALTVFGCAAGTSVDVWLSQAASTAR